VIVAGGERRVVAAGLVVQVVAAALAVAAFPRLALGSLHASVPSLLAGAATGAALYALLARVPALAAAGGAAGSPALRGLAVTVIAWAEETLWRGVLLGALAPRSAGFALALSTAGFAASHVYGQGWGALRTHALTGLAFGGLYLATGSLAAAIAAHAVYNLSVVVVGARRARGAATA